jgi:hypothetical protein
MTDTDAAALAAHAYDQHMESIHGPRGLRPDAHATAVRNQHIQEASADPDHICRLRAVYPNIATACDSCGHDNAADLRWLTSSGTTALCRSVPGCNRRHATQAAVR